MALELGNKLALYVRAATATRSANLRGFPLLPKSSASPSCRGSYNTFLLWLRQLDLANAANIFDVGANRGDFARAASACYPNARLWLFEPLPSLHPALARLAQRHRTWKIEPFALGNIEGNLPLHVATDDSIGSFLGFSEAYQQGNPAAQVTDTIQSSVERLDDFCTRAGVGAIDILKIDVEGFEFDVLAGGEHMLRTTTAIIVEVSLIRQENGSATLLARMIRLLSDAGFSIVDVIPSLFAREAPWKPLEYNLLARR